MTKRNTNGRNLREILGKAFPLCLSVPVNKTNVNKSKHNFIYK